MDSSSNVSLGQRLRSARLAQGMTTEDVAARLKLPIAIVEAMERDDHAVLGAAIYARGRLGNYARLLGIPASAVEAQFANSFVALPPLVNTARDTRFERGLQRIARQGIYVVLTATIVLPVIWLATHHQLPQSAASLTTLDAPPAAGQAANKPAPATSAQRAPLAASIAPFGSYRASTAAGDAGAVAAPIATPATTPDSQANAANASANPGLELRFSGDSWVELIGVDGRVIERGMIEAGSVRDYKAGAVARVAIGNTNAVRVLQGGETLDLSPFSRANVARFTLSSDGKPAPAGD